MLHKHRRPIFGWNQPMPHLRIYLLGPLLLGWIPRLSSSCPRHRFCRQKSLRVRINDELFSPAGQHQKRRFKPFQQANGAACAAVLAERHCIIFANLVKHRMPPSQVRYPDCIALIRAEENIGQKANRLQIGVSSKDVQSIAKHSRFCWSLSKDISDDLRQRSLLVGLAERNHRAETGILRGRSVTEAR